MAAPDTKGAATPGPWVIQDNAAHGIHIYGPGGPFGGGKHLARASNSAGVDVLANARLIAAAPAMLAALEADASALENIHAYLRRHEATLPPMSLASLEVRLSETRAAIAAARGEAS